MHRSLCELPQENEICEMPDVVFYDVFHQINKGAKMSEKKNKQVKHGAYLWLKDKKIHPSIRGHQQIRKYLRHIEKDLIDQHGGSENITPSQEIMIRTVIEAYGFILLGAIYCKRDGILNPVLLKKGIVSFQPVLSNQFIAFMNTIRQNLISLGLEAKDAEKILTPLEFAEQFDKEKERKAKTASKAKV